MKIAELKAQHASTRSPWQKLCKEKCNPQALRTSAGDLPLAGAVSACLACSNAEKLLRLVPAWDESTRQNIAPTWRWAIAIAIAIAINLIYLSLLGNASARDQLQNQ